MARPIFDHPSSGPKPKPYDVRLSRWLVVSPDDPIWIPRSIGPRLVIPTPPEPDVESENGTDQDNPVHHGSPTWEKVGEETYLQEIVPDTARVAAAAARLVIDREVPVLRRYIESTLVHVGRFDPDMVRKVLDDWKKFLPGTIVVSALDVPGEFPSHAYGTRAVTDEERGDLTALVEQRRRVLDKDRLAIAGEEYVRACFKRSKLYSDVTQKGRLGYVVAEPGANRVDTFTTEKASGTRFAVSVRNRRKVLEPRSDWINNCVEMAETNGASPWIIPSFATEKAIAECAAQGIRCTPTGARVMPAEDGNGRLMRNAVRDLYPILGGEPFVYIGKNRLLEVRPLLVERIISVTQS